MVQDLTLLSNWTGITDAELYSSAYCIIDSDLVQAMALSVQPALSVALSLSGGWSSGSTQFLCHMHGSHLRQDMVRLPVLLAIVLGST